MSAVAEQRLTAAKATSEWVQIAAQAPQMADTLGRYLVQVGAFLAPRSVEAADTALRQLARWLLDHTDIRSVAGIGRNDIEDFKVWLASRPGVHGRLTREHATAATANAASLLRTDHRVGLVRYSAPQSDPRPRPPTAPRTVAPLPRRP